MLTVGIGDFHLRQSHGCLGVFHLELSSCRFELGLLQQDPSSHCVDLSLASLHLCSNRIPASHIFLKSKVHSLTQHHSERATINGRILVASDPVFLELTVDVEVDGRHHLVKNTCTFQVHFREHLDGDIFDITIEVRIVVFFEVVVVASQINRRNSRQISSEVVKQLNGQIIGPVIIQVNQRHLFNSSLHFWFSCRWRARPVESQPDRRSLSRSADPCIRC